MFKINFVIAIRNIKSSFRYSIIKIISFAAAIACCAIVFLYAANEFSYDKHHPYAERTFRVAAEIKSPRSNTKDAITPAVAPLENTFSQVEKSARIFSYSWKEKALFTTGAKTFYEGNFFLADPTIFEIFSFEFIYGSPKSAFNEINSVVLTESIAKKYFGEVNIVGKTIAIKNMSQADFVVTGVIKDPNSNSHFTPEILAPLKSGNSIFWPNFEARNQFYNYIVLKGNNSAADFQANLNSYYSSLFGNRGVSIKIFLQPITDIHLHSDITSEIKPNGSINYIYLLCIIGILMLGSAVINFINLSTAQSEKRSKEIGLRKIVGASRPQLICQFLIESVAISFVSVPLALLFMELLIPPFKNIFNANISLSLFSNYQFVIGFFLIIFIAGLVAGIYPAIILSSTNASRSLQNRSRTVTSKPRIRNILVVAQYTASIILISATIALIMQMDFIKNRNNGYRKENILIANLPDYDTIQKINIFKTSLLNEPTIESVTAGTSPIDIKGSHKLWYEGLDETSEINIFWADVDYGYFKTFNIQFAEGRDFLQDFPSDLTNGYVINEAAVKAFGWNSGEGKSISLSNKGLMRPIFEKGQVIGVVKDFNFQSLHSNIKPLIFTLKKQPLNTVIIKISGSSLKQSVAAVTRKWEKLFSGTKIDLTYFDEKVNKLYETELRTTNIFSYAALISIIITILGLNSMASFNTSARTKEIGVRKILGAGLWNIVYMLSRVYLLLFTISSIIAWPVVYYFINSWLNKFAYKISIGFELFLTATLMSFFVIFISVSYNTFKAVYSNPVDSLRSE